MTPILEFEGVERSFKRGTPVLDGVTFAVQPGEVVGLLGRNGAGKTTLIRTTLDLIQPQAGAVRVFGISPAKDPVAIKRRLGYAAQDHGLPEGLKVTDLLALCRYLYPQWDGYLERHLLDQFELDASSEIGKLSQGQKQQASLLCAVCHRPELLLLDEPAAGLDPVARRDFIAALTQLMNREGTTILFSSHNSPDVTRIANRVVMLDGGKVRVDSELAEGFSVVFSNQSQMGEAAWGNLPGFVFSRAGSDGSQVYFSGAPVEVSDRLRAALAERYSCVRNIASVSLEELFIAVAGKNREK